MRFQLTEVKVIIWMISMAIHPEAKVVFPANTMEKVVAGAKVCAVVGVPTRVA
jgi:hypothetical protein